MKYFRLFSAVKITWRDANKELTAGKSYLPKLSLPFGIRKSRAFYP